MNQIKTTLQSIKYFAECINDRHSEVNPDYHDSDTIIDFCNEALDRIRDMEIIEKLNKKS